MRKQTFASIWDAIEDDRSEALNLKLRAKLMIAVEQKIKDKKLSQTAAAKLLGVTQPRISDLYCGRIDLFSLDTLVNMLDALGVKVEIRTNRLSACA
jgi:predicted XRE-type DNA-binding protein